MKKLLLFVAAAAVMLTSCQKSLNENESVLREIQLGLSAIEYETKAFVESTNGILQSNGFKAAAVIDADNSTIFNKAVTYNNGVYSVSGEHYYFPNEGTVSFYGVYPADEVIAIADDGKASVAYVHNSDDDLIGAKKSGVASQSDAVALEFTHLLSQISINVKTDDANVICKLYSITISDADGGTYSFSDDSWTLSETKADYAFFVKTDGQAVTTTAAAVGSAMSFMPGKVTLNAKWKCYNSVGDQLISDNDETIPVTLTRGNHTAISLLLPANSTEMKLSTSVGAWINDLQELKVAPYFPELLSGVFTVKAATETEPAKKVKFTKGNLYWNGGAFLCEENQYDYPTAWDATHVGHFYWSKDVRVAYAENYDAANTAYGITPDVGDKFFAADGGVIKGLTILDNDEWQYLVDNAIEDEMDAIEIDGKKCFIFKPDGFSGTVEDSYTAEAWASAEATYGLVALPLASDRQGIEMAVGGDSNETGFFWSLTPGGASDQAYGASNVSLFFAVDGSFLRNNGYSVRLVQVQ